MKVKRDECIDGKEVCIFEEVPRPGISGTISGQIFINLNGCKAKTKCFTNNAYLYWSGYVQPKTGAGKVKILDTMVTRQARRQGLATMMYDIVEQRLRELGVKEVYGVATEDGENFWPTVGFTVNAGPRPLGSGHDIVKRIG